MYNIANMKRVFFILVAVLNVNLFAQIRDGIYQFDNQRILKSIDLENHYSVYGVKAFQDIVKTSSGNAVKITNGTFIDPENSLLLSIKDDGTISSPENTTIKGSYIKGNFSYYGFYGENNQTIHIICSGKLTRYTAKELASKAFNGEYHTTDSGTNRKQIVTVKNGLYSWKYEDEKDDDFRGWPCIIQADGSFSYSMEYTVRSIFENISNSIITSKTLSSGQLNPNGNISLKVLTTNTGSGDFGSGEPVFYSAVKASNEISQQSDPEIYISAGKKKTAVSLSSGKIDYPEWYTEKLEITEGYYKACAYKKGGIDDHATQKIAELTALSQISAYIGTNIQINSTATVSIDSTDTEKYLYKTMDKIISRKIDYELCNLQKNENQGITFVQIEVKRDLNSEQP